MIVAMISCQGLEAFLLKPTKSLLFTASLELLPGKRYAVMGPSGCGKSVLTKYLAGLLPDKSSETTFRHQSFRQASSILYLPQDSKDSVLPWRSAREVFKRNCSLVKTLGLQYSVDKCQYPRTMSGGELRRLALGELLVMGERKALILDEPLNGLDEDLRGRCAQAINEYMNSNPSTCLIFVTHYQQERDELEADLIKYVRKGHSGEFCHVP